MKRSAILFLTLTLTLVSAYQAVMHLAHGMAGTGLLVELCIDGQARTIAVGPGGEPQPISETAHDCTDCVLGTGLGLPRAADSAEFTPLGRALAHLPQTTLPQQGSKLAAAHARAPPVLV